MARVHPVRHASQASATEDMENRGYFTGASQSSQYSLADRKTSQEPRNEEVALAPQKKRSALGDLTNSSGESTARRRPATKLQVKPANSARQLPSRQEEGDFAAQQDSVSGRLQAFEQAQASSGRSRHQGLNRQPQQPQPRRTLLPRGVHDIDSLCSTLGCPDYIQSIMQHLHHAENKRRPNMEYMESIQRDITVDMRCTLVDWLVEVALEFRVVSDTLFLAVSFLDRYLSMVPTERGNLQLVGVTCLLIACKYEEIYAPQVDDFVRITDDSYTRDEVIQMEEHILELLDFELTQPTAKTFVRRFVQAAIAGRLPDQRLEHLCAYFVELALCEYGALQYLPSQIAASAVLLAQHCLGAPIWSPTLNHYCEYRPSDLQRSVRLLHYVAISAAAQQPLPISTEKFSSSRYKSVSRIPLPAPPLPASLFLNHDY